MINSITKSLAVLRAFTDEKCDWGVNELARYLDTPPSSLHRILKTLREENILKIDEASKKYQIGEEMIRLSSVVSSKVGIKTIAHQPLQKLADRIEETVYLAQYHSTNDKLSFIDCYHSVKNQIQYVLEIGTLQTLTLGASGKVILANLPEDRVLKIMDCEEVPIDKRDKMNQQFQFIKNNGFLITQNERNVGACGIAAPIFSGKGVIVGSVSCVIPTKFFDEDSINFKAINIVNAAKEISILLGY